MSGPMVASLVVVWLALMAGTARAADFREVEADGRADPGLANAREVALTDALREAVRTGVGVNLVDSTQVKDFVLDFDRIFASSFGYVRSFRVLSNGTESDGLYHVRIRAQVGQGQPGWNDMLALRQLVHLRKSPRVALDVDETIDGVAAGSGFARAWLEEQARELQLMLVDLGSAMHQDDRLRRRDELFGDEATAAIRRAGIAQQADFIIQAKVRGRYLGHEKLYDALPAYRFSLALDLRALQPDTGAVVASAALPAFEADRHAGGTPDIAPLLPG